VLGRRGCNLSIIIVDGVGQCIWQKLLWCAGKKKTVHSQTGFKSMVNQLHDVNLKDIFFAVDITNSVVSGYAASGRTGCSSSLVANLFNVLLTVCV